MNSMILIPTELWAILGAIICFYFGSRVISDRNKGKLQVEVTKAKTQAVLQNIKSIQSLRETEMQQIKTRSLDNTHVNQLIDEDDESDDSDENKAVEAITKRKK